MPINQQPLNYALQYARELANAYPYLSYFPEVWASPNNAMYRPVSAQTILIPSMSVGGAKAVNRDEITGSIKRNFNSQYEPKTMTMYRYFQTIVDPMDVVETNEVATIANITRTFNEFQKIPEMDAYASSKCSGFAASFGGVDSATLTAANILTQWDAALAYMTSQRVPRDRLRAYMTPAVYQLLKQASGITRFLDVAGVGAVNRNVSSLDGVQIREVPPDMMMSAYDFTDGWVAAAGAKQINLLLIDPATLIAPVVYDVSMITPPSAVTQGKTVYFESYYYDLFALNNRQAGIFANMSAPTLGGVTVTSAAGTVTGESVITYLSAQLDTRGEPYPGLDAYYSAGNAAAPTVTYGAALPGGATWTKCSGVNPVKLTGQTAGKYATVALVNKQTGFAIAAGSAVEVVK